MALSLPIVTKFDDKGINQAKDSLSSFAKGAGIAVGAAFAAAGAAAVAFGAASLKAAAESEAVSRGLENAAKNAGVFGDSAAAIGKATEALDKHSTKLAEMTGIDDEIINQIKTGWLAVPSLAAMGTEGINNLAEVTADVAAGTGKDVQAIGLAFQRVAGDTESAFSKLTRAGIVFTDEQKATFDSLLATSGEMSAQQYLIEELGTKYEGAAAAAANPFERLQVIFENLQETVGAALLPAVEAIVPVVQEFVESLTSDPAFEQFLTTLATSFMSLLEALMPLMEPVTNLLLSLLPPLMSIFELLIPVIVGLVEAFMPMIEAILPPLLSLIETLLPPLMELFMAILTPLIPIIVKLVEAFVPLISAILPPLLSVVNALVPVFFALIDAFLPLIEKLLPPLLDLFLAILEPLSELLVDILPFLIPVIEAVGDTFEWLIDNILNPLIEALTIAVGWFAQLFGFDGKSVNVGSSVPQPYRSGGVKLAQGGIVMPRPGGTLATIGEAGQAEAVIPLNKFDDVVGKRGGANVNIVVNAGMGTDGAAVGEQIVNAIRRYERTSGAVFAKV